ncbi:MAG TPA: alpha/beta hydrolase [Streptosporangiaceae bacterium]|nr:alpha/beta hydrolase [Streptosporangiaceae bacterium]
MAEVSARGVRFHVQRLHPPAPAAGAPVVVFVHGLVVDNLSSFYYTLAGPAVAAGARAILYDLRGHGMSERPPRGYSTHDAVADLCALLDALGVDEPVYLVGNSYGGVVATRMALTSPERVAGLVVIEAHCAGEGAARWFEDMANTLTVAALGLEYDRVQDLLRALGQRKLARLATHADSLLNETTLINDLAAEQPLTVAELSAVRCPVLGVYGERSELAGAADDLARYVPDCRVEVMPGLAHTVLREATGPLRDVITGWLVVREPVG